MINSNWRSFLLILCSAPLAVAVVQMQQLRKQHQDDCYLFTLGTTSEFLYYSTFHISLDFMKSNITLAGHTKVLYVHCVEYDVRKRRLYYTTYPFGSTYSKRTIFYVEVSPEGTTTTPRPFFTASQAVGSIAIEQSSRRLYFLTTYSVSSIDLDATDEEAVATVHYEAPTHSLLDSTKYQSKTFHFAVHHGGRYAYVASQHGENEYSFKIQRLSLTGQLIGGAKEIISDNRPRATWTPPPPPGEFCRPIFLKTRLYELTKSSGLQSCHGWVLPW